MTSSPCTMTAPTIGFGAVCPQPRRANDNARRMYARSRSRAERSSIAVRSESKAESERPIPPRLIGHWIERVVGGHTPTPDVSRLAHDLEERHVQREIQEGAGARGLRAQRERISGPDTLHIVRERGVAIILVLPDAGRHPEEREVLSRD